MYLKILGCADHAIRIEGGSYHEGHVEICLGGVWGRMCGHFWDERDASVVCQELGFTAEGERISLC